MNTLQKTAIAAAISGLFAPAAFAQATPSVEVSPVTANVSLVSDYRFRGSTQSNDRVKCFFKEFIGISNSP